MQLLAVHGSCRRLFLLDCRGVDLFFTFKALEYSLYSFNDVGHRDVMME